eukprot:1155918-Pelagomonas_calceolata.AAC.6
MFLGSMIEAWMQNKSFLCAAGLAHPSTKRVVPSVSGMKKALRSNLLKHWHFIGGSACVARGCSRAPTSIASGNDLRNIGSAGKKISFLEGTCRFWAGVLRPPIPFLILSNWTHVHIN